MNNRVEERKNISNHFVRIGVFWHLEVQTLKSLWFIPQNRGTRHLCLSDKIKVSISWYQILDGNEAYWWLTQVEMRKWVAKRKYKLKLHLETEKKRVFDSRTLKVWSYRLLLIHHHSQNCWIWVFSQQGQGMDCRHWQSSGSYASWPMFLHLNSRTQIVIP
jgi:hypothetical protein